MLAACSSSTFVPDNTRRFVCDETASACVDSGIDPTCATTYSTYHDNVVCATSGAEGVAACGSYNIGSVATGGERQWTVFDRGSGAFVAILSIPPTGATRCEVGPHDFDLGCDPTMLAFEFDTCPVHEDAFVMDASVPPPDAGMGMADAGTTTDAATMMPPDAP